ncbi:hypothetical protein HC928_24305 [bacterium]|nr:hypothetical protein [bacterium]
MTLDELKTTIAQIVDEKLAHQMRSRDTRSVEEILAAMDRLRWTPPLTSPSTTELLREERDR